MYIHNIQYCIWLIERLEDMCKDGSSHTKEILYAAQHSQSEMKRGHNHTWCHYL